MALIELQNISKSYGHGQTATEVLRGINLSVDKGEFVAVVGASGSGKTTLMNIIGLLDRPSGGNYQLNGTDADRLKEKERARSRREQIGFVFQGFNLIPRLSASANIELPMVYDRVSKKDRQFQSTRLLDLVGLSDRGRNRPSQLSGGEMQRVAIARALANRPSLILADEPTGNLDSRTGQVIMGILTKLNKKGATIVLITHNPNVAQHAQRTVRISDGQLVESQNVTEKQLQPAKVIRKTL